VRRSIARIVTLLICGAIVSVVVALAASLRVQLAKLQECELPASTLALLQRRWADQRPTDWPDVPSADRAGASRGLAYTVGGLNVQSDTAVHLLKVFRAGWPWTCLAGHEWKVIHLTPDPVRPDSRIIAGRTAQYDHLAVLLPGELGFGLPRRSGKIVPYGIDWPGFLLGALFWGAVIGVLWWTLRAGRRQHRRRRGRCIACGYPIGASDVCTECGRRLATASS